MSGRRGGEAAQRTEAGPSSRERDAAYGITAMDRGWRAIVDGPWAVVQNSELGQH